MAGLTREKKLLLLTAVIVILAIFWWSGDWIEDRVSFLSADYGEVHERFETFRNDLERLKELQAEVQRRKERLGNPDAQFATEDGMHDLIASLEALGGKAGVGLSNYRFAPTKEGKATRRFRIVCNYSGKFEKIPGFFQALESSELFLTPEKVQMTVKDEKKGLIGGSITLIAYGMKDR